MKTFTVTFTLFLLITLNGCTTMSIDDHKISDPELILEDYFTGSTRAWGFFQDRNGNIKKQFTVDITGRMEANKLILEEDFVYTNGSTDRRVWHITRTGKKSYSGIADDVVGEATGVINGNAFNWRYTLALPVNGRIVNVQLDDWMYLQPDGVLLNRAKMSKFGIRLGDITLVFRQNQSDTKE